MKTRNKILLLLGMAALLAACTQTDETVDFGTDQKEIKIGADGGTHSIRISSGDNWIARSSEPWITVSPANGRGSVDCQILVDSALTANTRTGIITIVNQVSSKETQINVSQDGYEYSIVLDDDEAEVEIPNYARLENRYFYVKVLSNVDFDIEIPEEAKEWISYDNYKVNLSRGLRPRETKIRFNWSVSSVAQERTATIKFKPKDVTAERADALFITQGAAPEIIPNTRQGDSVALLCIARGLNTWFSWESAEPMDNWSSVTLWEEGMEGAEGRVGRVKSADFFLFNTKEGIPQEVQYLTEAESLSFRSNENSFLRDLDPGVYITRLPKLKSLTIWAYGLTELNDSLKRLENLEYLNLAANNYSDFPEVLKKGKENFPKLKTLLLNANQRYLVYDINNDNRTTELGGFIDATEPDGEFPRWLLEWDTLETLALGVNYLQGHFPTLEDDPNWPKYDLTDVANSQDSLPSNGTFDYSWNDDNSWNPDKVPTSIIGLPKVWPNLKVLGINYNRMTGLAPNWLLFHPALDWWLPFTFVFNPEGKDKKGRVSKFDNEPATTLDYYYKFYTKKKNPYEEAEDDQ